ncbi:GNAT family N-acetyltransferase [Neptunicella marina]|uniref:GNAT family N-acetyltransferase n=1 Tax=Neptunicella marina TaxID=2125989 RepID=UPI0019D59CCA|nr:GNAT family N-acetyltransferase [Neptunicella marina]
MDLITTKRLSIDLLSTDDADFIVELLNQPDFIEHIGDRGVRTPADARRYIINGPQKSYVQHGFGLWKVSIKQSGQAIGMAGLLQRPNLISADIGYGFLPIGRGQGYALEAAEAILQFANHELRLVDVVALVSHNNSPSIRLLEKLGMTFHQEHFIPGENVSCLLYG